jgi:hypothetical protein
MTKCGQNVVKTQITPYFKGKSDVSNLSFREKEKTTKNSRFRGFSRFFSLFLTHTLTSRLFQ